MKPNINERMARHAANNEERERKESERIERAIAHRAFTDELSAWKERMEFDLYLVADRILEALERQRDMHMPKPPDYVWDEAFCTAVETIPEARRFMEDCMMKCTKEKEV